MDLKSDLGASTMSRLVAELANGDLELQERAAELLMGQGPTVVESLLETLPSETSQTRLAISDVLVRMCPGALPSLLRDLGDPESRIKKWVSRALRRVELSVPEVRQVLELTASRDPWVRKYAYKVLGRHDNDEVMETLWDRLGEARAVCPTDLSDLRWLSGSLRERFAGCSSEWAMRRQGHISSERPGDWLGTPEGRDLLGFKVSSKEPAFVRLRHTFLERLASGDEPSTREAFFAREIELLEHTIFGVGRRRSRKSWARSGFPANGGRLHHARRRQS